MNDHTDLIVVMLLSIAFVGVGVIYLAALLLGVTGRK